MEKVLSPNEIKRALERAGYSQANVADSLEVSRAFVNQVIHNKATSHKVRCFIAKKIKRPVDEVFNINRNPSKPGPKRR